MIFFNYDIGLEKYSFTTMIFVSCFFAINLDSAYGQVFLQNVNMTDNLSNWGTDQITLSNIIIQEDGITLQKNEASEARKFSFFRMGSLNPYTITLENYDSSINFAISSPGLNDTMLNVSGTQISSLHLDGVLSSGNLFWDGSENTIQSGDAQSICLFCSNYTTTITISDQNSCQTIGSWNAGTCTISDYAIENDTTLAIASGTTVLFTGTVTNLGIINNMGNITNSGIISNLGTINSQCGAIYVGSLPSGNQIVDLCPFCIPSVLSDWMVDSSCQLADSVTVNEDVIVQNDSTLVIPGGKTLDVDFAQKHLLIKSGSKVLIKSGGTIR